MGEPTIIQAATYPANGKQACVESMAGDNAFSGNAARLSSGMIANSVMEADLRPQLSISELAMYPAEFEQESMYAGNQFGSLHNQIFSDSTTSSAAPVHRILSTAQSAETRATIQDHPHIPSPKPGPISDNTSSKSASHFSSHNVTPVPSAYGTDSGSSSSDESVRSGTDYLGLGHQYNNDPHVEDTLALGHLLRRLKRPNWRGRQNERDFSSKTRTQGPVSVSRTSTGEDLVLYTETLRRRNSFGARGRDVLRIPRPSTDSTKTLAAIIHDPKDFSPSSTELPSSFAEVGQNSITAQPRHTRADILKDRYTPRRARNRPE